MPGVTLILVARRLTEPQRKQVILQQLTALRDGKFAGNLSETARALGVTPAFLSNLLNGKRGYGLKIIDALADITGKSVAEVLNEQDPPWSGIPGWEQALAAARAQVPGVDDAAWRWLGSLSGPTLPGLDPNALALMAMAWDQARLKLAAQAAPPPSGVVRQRR